MMRQAEACEQGNMELEDFVESCGVSMDDFEAQCQQYAQAKVKQNLLIRGIMDAEGMALEDIKFCNPEAAGRAVCFW
ncbi:MAG: hypothetical protein ACLRMZ_27405 [Blautia marasmi]